MTTPYDPEAFWIKAKLFLNHAMDSDGPRTFDEQALWASLALELLGKAALSRVSPLLIATPTEDGVNLLIATGLVSGEARFHSIPAASLYKRCHKAFKPFSDREAILITNARNEYLHGTGVGFSAIPPEAWWPRYWAQAEILVTAMDRTLEELVGLGRLETVEGHLAQNRRNVELRVEMLLSRASQRLKMYRSGSLPVKTAREWGRSSDLTAGLSHRSTATCPACGGEGILEGSQVEDTEIAYEQLSEEDFEAYVTLTVGSEYFSCPTCKLVLDGYELLTEAGLPESFETEGDAADAYEADYGND